MARSESQFQFYSRSPAIERAGQALLDRYPQLVDYATESDTAGSLYLRVLSTFADPAQARSQRDLLGLPATASREQIVKTFSRALDGIMPAREVPGALAAAQQAATADKLYSKITGNEADAARVRNGGKAPVEKPERRKLTDEEIRREDLKAALREHGDAVDTGSRDRGTFRPSSSMQTDIAMSLFQHGALDRKIEIDSPGFEAWSKEGSDVDRYRSTRDAVQEREISDRADQIRDWAVPADDGHDEYEETTND